MIRPLLLTILAAAPLAYSAPLQSAEVTQVVNDVRIYQPGAGGRTASVGASIKGRTSVLTGAASRSELTFQDETITRLGANTSFSFAQGTRDLTLEQGSLLLQVPKNAGGARIRTSSVTAAISGTTILIEFFRGKWIKIIVLEGRLTAFLNQARRRVTIEEGQMLFMRDNGQDVPNPVDLDLERLIATSMLVKLAPLPEGAEGRIARRIAIQKDERQRGILLGSGMVQRTKIDQAMERQRQIQVIREESSRFGNPTP